MELDDSFLLKLLVECSSYPDGMDISLDSTVVYFMVKEIIQTRQEKSISTKEGNI